MEPGETDATGLNRREADDLPIVGGRRLDPVQWERLRQRALARAQEARGRALRGYARAVVAGMSAAVAAAQDTIRGIARRAWRAHALRRERRSAVKELNRLDDRALKDMGLHRSEIESVVYGRDAFKVAQRAMPRVYRPPMRASAAKPAARPLVNKSAA